MLVENLIPKQSAGGDLKKIPILSINIKLYKKYVINERLITDILLKMK